MGPALKAINVLCVLLAVNIRSKLTRANTTLTVINSNLSTESTTNQETTIELSTISTIVTLNTGMSSETTSMKLKHNLSDSIMFECTLELADYSLVQKVHALVAENKELIFIHFHLLNQTPILLGPNDTIYDILTIVRTAGGFGNELLEMHPQFEQLSIGTLMFGVEHINIALRIMSRGCSRQKELQSALLSIVSTELDLLQMANDNEFTRLCQMHAENVSGLASFYYNCCTVDGNGDFACNRLEITQWMTVLLFCMTISYVLVFLYSPLLIPTSWYKTYVNEITLRVEQSFILELHETSYENGQIKLKQIKVPLLPDQKDKTVIKIKVKEIKLKMLETNTVSTDYVPAGVFHYLYRTFIKCHVRDHEYVKTCCNTDICIIAYFKGLVWLKCLLPLMQPIFLMLLLIPWIVRIIFFIIYESEDRTNRESFARKINLKYPNILQWSLTYSLKPNHPFFICVYGLIVFVPFSKIFLKRAMQTSGFNNNKRRFNLDTKKLVQFLILPCKQLGLIGCFISPFYIVIILPIVIIRFILPYIPIFKVSWTLLCSIAQTFRKMYKEKLETRTCMKVVEFFFRSVFLVIVFMAIGSSMVICLEVAIFFLQIGMYFSIGIILNASLVLTYVTFAGMLLFYVYDTLRNVKKKYEAFSQAIIDFFINEMEKQVIETFTETEKLKNTAFQFKTSKEGSNKSHIEIQYDDTCNKLLLQSKIPCLFFDENSKPYLNERAFFKMCYMKVLRAPGSLWENYKKAAINFLMILLFLTLVVIVVFTFGKTQGIPGTYQAIATLGGGLIPLILRRYFFKSDDVFTFKSDNFLLFEELNQMFKDYSETWEILEIPGIIYDDKCGDGGTKYDTLSITSLQHELQKI